MNSEYDIFIKPTENTFTIDFSRYGLVNDDQIMRLSLNEIYIKLTTGYVGGLMITSNLGKENYIDEIGSNPLFIIPCQNLTSYTFYNNFKTSLKIYNPYNKKVDFTICESDGTPITSAHITSILIHFKIK